MADWVKEQREFALRIIYFLQLNAKKTIHLWPKKTIYIVWFVDFVFVSSQVGSDSFSTIYFSKFKTDMFDLELLRIFYKFIGIMFYLLLRFCLLSFHFDWWLHWLGVGVQRIIRNV